MTLPEPAATPVSADLALGRGAVMRALAVHSEQNINLLLAYNWLAAALMAVTAYALLPAQRQWVIEWFAVGTAYSLTFLLWRLRNGPTIAPKADALGGASADDARIAINPKIGLLFTGWIFGFSLQWVAMSILFFDPANFAFSMFMLTITGGMAAACVPILSVWLPLYWLFVVPPFLTQIVLFASIGSAQYRGVSVGMGLLMFSQLAFARNTNRTIIASIKLGLQNLKLVTSLKEKTAIAERANRAKTMFLAAAGHDLRQPAYAQTLFIDALDATELNPIQRDMLGHLRASSRASTEMLQTLLDFSRADAGAMKPQPKPMSLGDLLGKMGEEFGPQAYAKGLQYRGRASALCVRGDAQLIALVLRNLISNALRYTVQGGVLVGVRQRGRSVAIQVWDTGIGIAPDKHVLVFEEFLQLGNAERDHRKGLGIGLAIAERLARSMQATIRLASKPGSGSVFSLELAADCLVDAPLGGYPALLDTSQVQRPSRLPRSTILVVDDDETVRAGLAALLTCWGCQVLEAEGLADALALTESRCPDIVMTDYRLRDGVTGADVLHAMRQRFGPIPSIIVTGDTQPQRLQDAANQQATLLHKPVDTHLLRDAIETALLQKIPHVPASNGAVVLRNK